MQMTEQQVLEQGMALARMATENYTFRDMVVNLQNALREAMAEIETLKTPIEGLDEAEEELKG